MTKWKFNQVQIADNHCKDLPKLASKRCIAPFLRLVFTAVLSAPIAFILWSSKPISSAEFQSPCEILLPVP